MQTLQYNNLNEIYFQDLNFSHAEERNNEIFLKHKKHRITNRLYNYDINLFSQDLTITKIAAITGLSNATIVYDRFHIIKNFNEAINKIRMAEIKSLLLIGKTAEARE